MLESFFFKKLLRGRNNLLLIAVGGLALSALSLLVLQSTMGGLQNKLMLRSKEALGRFYLPFSEGEESKLEDITKRLSAEGLVFSREYFLEGLIRHEGYISWAKISGLDSRFSHPRIPLGPEGALVLGDNLARFISAYQGDVVSLISPAHVISFLGDVPRQLSAPLSGFRETQVADFDSHYVLASDSLVFRLTGKKAYNLIRIFSQIEREALERIAPHRVETWEERNQTLLWALQLESTVMLLLFWGMTVLVSLSITSGLMIFFDKIRVELVSLWILGLPKRKILFRAKGFLFLLGFFSTLLGLLGGLGLLYILKNFGGEILPAVFVDRKIPVRISGEALFISFAIPFFVSVFFSLWSLRLFKRDYRPIETLRALSSL